MIYVTGDTHGDFRRFHKESRFMVEYAPMARDYVIVCGDFGLLRERNGVFRRNLDFLKSLPFTVLWVRGNQENHDMIAEYPLEKWHGGMARHIIRDKVILLERGQVFQIEGKRFFIFGGAGCHDVGDSAVARQGAEREGRDSYRCRILGGTRQRQGQGLPTKKEMREGIRNLKNAGYSVDYVITHCLAGNMMEKLRKFAWRYLDCPMDSLTGYFDLLESRLQYKHWYCGHYHMYSDIDEKHTLLFQMIEELR